jgi:hypothetical protein
VKPDISIKTGLEVSPMIFNFDRVLISFAYSYLKT